MKKTFKVIMLPTEKAINDYSLVLLPKNKLHIMSPSDTIDYLDSQSNATKRQELYIISDDEIREGDWAIFQDGRVRQFIKGMLIKQYPFNKKIVATTDKSLTISATELLKLDTEYREEKVNVSLPQIPESFIQAYIKAYNEAKPITEVDLEMCIREDNFNANPGTWYDTIKTRPDNTVIIHQNKMYSREEWVSMIRGNEEQIAYYGIDKWIRDNL